MKINKIKCKIIVKSIINRTNNKIKKKENM